MFGLGLFEIIIILFVALIFIGPKKLPEVAKNLGKGLRDFQNAVKGITDANTMSDNNPPPMRDAEPEEDLCESKNQDDEDVIHTTATHNENNSDIDKKES